MSDVAVWTAGLLLGAGAATLTAWLGLVWWFGDRDLFKRQYPAHRAGDEPEPRFPEPSLRIPPNLFSRGAQVINTTGLPDGYTPPSASLEPPPTYPETPEEGTR